MSELLRFFKDMRDNGYGLAEIAAQLGTSAIAEPVAGFAAMYDPVHGADAIREGMTYQPRTQEAQEYSQSIGNAAKTAIKPAMPIIDTWKKGVDIAGQYSPVVGAGLRTVPAAIGIAMGAKPALQAGRQVSEGLGAMQGRMIANANAPRTLNAGYMGQRGAINPSDFNLVTNPDGTVTMYHGTTKDAAKKIIQERKLLSAGEPDVYMTTDPMAGYGDGTTVKFNIDPKHINLDDEFPSGRVDFRMPAAKGWRIQNPEINTPKRPLTEFEQAHLLAQQRAALPVNQRGLDLPADNTAMDRARAMGWADDGYHGTSSDFPEFSLGGYGVHGNVGGTGVYLGVPDMASSYAQTASSLTGKPANVMPLLTRGKLLDTNSEAPLNNNLIDKYINENLYDGDKARIALDAGGKRTTRTFENIEDAKDFFWNQKKNWEAFGGFDRTLPKADMIDGKPVVSYVDLNAPVSLNGLPTKEVHEALRRAGGGTMTDILKNIGYDGTKSARETVIFDPKNIRSRFAAFDPFNRESSNLLAQSAKLAPTTALGAYMYNEKRKKSQGKQ